MNIEDFNQLSKKAELLEKCCGASRWIQEVSSSTPFESEAAFFKTVYDTWFEKCGPTDYLEAFQHHPKIGDIDSLREKFAASKDWAGKEQSGVEAASEECLNALAKANEDYEEKFGFIFIVCATGKTADEMLCLVQERMQHDRDEEIAIARNEQFKITILRLRKAMDLEYPRWSEVSQVTTHVLDTSLGKPGAGICIKLRDEKGTTIGMGITNSDGRIADLLPPGVELEPGYYEMYFKTGDYYKALDQQGFYPAVGINFETFDKTHYHVPLLINPFGYSTYRGS